MTETTESSCLDEITKLIEQIENVSQSEKNMLMAIDDDHQDSAKNLLHYCEMRKTDLSLLQQKLGLLGISRLARSEEHVLPSLQQIANVLSRNLPQPTTSEVTGKKLYFESLLEKHTRSVLGPEPSHRRSRIMVTIPTEAFSDRNLVENMIKSGMNVARINCAHDDPKVWLQMIRTLRAASEKLQQPIKIIMDLAGPKIRTEIARSTPEVRKIKPDKDELGRVIATKRIKLAVNSNTYSNTELPLESKLKPEKLQGNVLELVDARNKKRTFEIQEAPEAMYAVFHKTTYLLSGLPFYQKGTKKKMGSIGALPAIEAFIDIREGDEILLTKLPTSPDETDKKLNCTFPEVIDRLEVTHRVFFDDGKIEGVVVRKQADAVWVSIRQTIKEISKLKSDKGINLPDTTLTFDGLSEKDASDLAFICKHADGVHVSFISEPSDVSAIIQKITEYGVSDDFSVILKIENKSSFKNLKCILLSALQWKTVGVTIARGDLAIETGWDNIGRLQKEIIKMANAAHIPVIWATQVLDSLAKNGFPSRSEVTDAATAIRAECVMLNKGPYIIKAIKFLDKLLADTELFQKKNVAMLPKMMELK